MCRPIAAGAALLLLSLVAESPAHAQLFESGESGARPLLPRADEIALARSAAPPAVSDSADVYVLTADGYELAVEGAGGAACYVSRDWVTSIEPHCFDSEGAGTIMRIHMRKVELLHGGASLEEASATLTRELAEGRHRLPRRPAMSWMMSSAQELVAPDGQSVGAWRPHVMIYYPFLTASEVAMGEATPMPLSALLSDGAGPLSSLVVVVPEFVEPAAP